MIKYKSATSVTETKKEKSATSVTNIKPSTTETVNHQNYIETKETGKHNNIINIAVEKTTRKKNYIYGNIKGKNINRSYRKQITERRNIVP